MTARHPAGDVLLDLCLEMGAQLAVQLIVHPIAVDERPKAQPRDVQPSLHR